MTFEETGDALRCRFSGDLIGTVCDEIKDRLDERIRASLEKHPGLKIEFDLKEVRLATSAFLRLCILYFKMVGAKRFRLLHLNDDIRNVFACSGLIGIMDYTEKGRQFDLSG